MNKAAFAKRHASWIDEGCPINEHAVRCAIGSWPDWRVLDFLQSSDRDGDYTPERRKAQGGEPLERSEMVRLTVTHCIETGTLPPPNEHGSDREQRFVESTVRLLVGFPNLMNKELELAEHLGRARGLLKTTMMKSCPLFY